jgi:hypothetical protein
MGMTRTTLCQLALSTALLFSGIGVALAADQPAAAPKPAAPAEKPAVDPNPPEGAKLDANGKPVGEGWIALFNGKDLTGFKFQPEYWKVEDGVIHGFTPGNKEHHYMYTEKSDYDDFELHGDVKLIGYNSGICIRIAPTNFDNVPGYQVDMGDGYWGCLWDERGTGMVAGPKKEVANQILHKDDWNHYYVIAQGHHIQIWFNGAKTVDTVHEKGKLTGPIGFQLCHAGKTDCSFKNLYVRPLKKADK